MVSIRIPLAALLASACAATVAQTQPPFDENTLRAFATAQIAGANTGLVSRFEVRFMPVDAMAATLAPCRRSEPFVPAGARLWGRSSLGLRCVEGAGWTVMLPMQVTAWGPALVAAQPLAAGTVISAQDLREGEVELTREPQPVARDISLLAGRTLLRAVNPGIAVRPDMVRVTLVVQAGDPVRLRITGAGFSVSGAGQALNNAGEGQSVRVRTDLGKLLNGVAREGRQVEVAL